MPIFFTSYHVVHEHYLISAFCKFRLPFRRSDCVFLAFLVDSFGQIVVVLLFIVTFADEIYGEPRRNVGEGLKRESGSAVRITMIVQWLKPELCPQR